MKHPTPYLLHPTKRKRLGLTMIELLIVIAILAILLIIFMWSFKGQTHKARDAKRKTDLHSYTNAMEDYFNDKGSYPPSGSLSNCQSNDLSPYVSKILCDPGAGDLPYDYIVDADGGWYGICADLENDTDPDIFEVGCGNGCGTGGDYDYCVLSGAAIEAVGGSYDAGGGGGVDGDGDGGGGIGDGPDIGDYACFSEICNNYDKGQYSCQFTFSTGTCDNLCAGGSYDCD